MNKVYIEGYEVGFSVDAIGNREKKIQVASGEIVSIDENFIYKSIETEKVKVQQFVADWINHSRNIGRSIFGAMSIFEENFEIKKWMQWADNQEIFARAWLDGYEVEKEKRYLVKVKGNIKENILVYGELLERYFFTKSLSLDNAIYSHTRKELEDADFGWVFDCPGIEIEEVE